MSEESATPSAVVITAACRRRASVLRCAGEADMTSAPQVREAADELPGHRPPALVVDFTDVRFLASAGIAALVAAQQEADRAGVAFAVVATGRSVPRPLQATGVDSMLTLFTTVDKAVDRKIPAPPPRRGDVEACSQTEVGVRSGIRGSSTASGSPQVPGRAVNMAWPDSTLALNNQRLCRSG